MNGIKTDMKKLEAVLSGKKGVIFDMDGTLLDSMAMWGTLDVQYLSSHGLEPDENFHEDVRTLTLYSAAEYIRDRYNLKYTSEEIAEQFLLMVDDYYRNTLTLKPGAEELVKKLYDDGIQMMVATANEYDMCEVALKRNGIMKYMDGLITCTMAGFGKDRPDIYIKACDMMKLGPEDCVVFEDSLFAIKTAKKAGFDVVGVYDESQDSVWNEICEITDCQVVFG